MTNNEDVYRGAFSHDDSSASGNHARQQAPPQSQPSGQDEPAPAGGESPTTVFPINVSEHLANTPAAASAQQPPSRGHYQQQQPPNETAYRQPPEWMPENSSSLVPTRRHAAPDSGPVSLDRADVKRMRVPAEKGWRSALYKSTRINLGPGKDERYEISLKERVMRPVRTAFPLAVINLKGGVGKTVTTKALGSVLAHVRNDRVVAVDLDNDSGNLVERQGRETPLNILDLVSDEGVRRYHDVRSHTSIDTFSQLEVLAQPDFARTDRTVEIEDFDKTMQVLEEHYGVVLFDCGTALKSELTAGVLNESRALVIVTSAAIDALEETDQTLEWLRHNGYQKLLENVVLVINHNEPNKPNVVVPKVIEQFSRKIPLERIFVVPFGRHVREGREINLKLLPKKMRRRYLEIGAALSDMFPKTID